LELLQNPHPICFSRAGAWLLRDAGDSHLSGHFPKNHYFDCLRVKNAADHVALSSSKPIVMKRLLCFLVLAVLAGSVRGQETGIERLPIVSNFRVNNAMITFSTKLPTGIDLDSTAISTANAVAEYLRKEPYYLSDQSPAGKIQIYHDHVPGEDSLKFSIPLPKGIFPGTHMFRIMYGDSTIFAEEEQVFSSNSKAGQQPTIASVSPVAASLAVP
jgi:hypothetical protein